MQVFGLLGAMLHRHYVDIPELWVPGASVGSVGIIAGPIHILFERLPKGTCSLLNCPIGFQD